LLLTFAKTYFILGLWKIFWIGFTWIGNFYALSLLLAYKENQGSDNLNGHLGAAMLGVFSMAGSLCFHQLTISSSRIGIQCRAALMVLVYRKSLKLSFIKGGVGEIVNLISVECNRMAEAVVDFHYLWSAALQCLVLLIFAFKVIGISSLVPVGLVIFIVFPLQFYLSYKASLTSVELTELITKRVHLMSEVLTAIKLIKFFAWEDYYRKKLSRMREIEMNRMKKELQLKIASFMVTFATPAVSVCLGIFLYQNATKLTPGIVFGLLFLFNTLRYPLYVLPNAERNISGAGNALAKLEEFLTLPEIDNRPEPSSSLEKDVCLQIKDADFVWDGDLDHPHLYELNLTLKRNNIVAVVGDIGSGKSLLAAIMGQIKGNRGVVLNDGCTFGFVPQEPWFINASLRDNILFGLDLNEKKYAEAIRISGLTRDFMTLSNGDQSYISDLNLSPSQKQRVSLARCMYQNPDLILMEDFLSDFDQTHAKQLFKESIINQLKKNRCVVMLTAQKQFLPDCDWIVVMKGGRIVEQGTYKELKAKNINFSAWVTDVVQIDDDPNNTLESISEIRLDPNTSKTSISNLSPLKPPLGNQLYAKSKVLSPKTRSSPLASADPIVAENIDPIRQIMELNSSSLQNSQLTEHAISKMIERNQVSILTGNLTRPPSNFANQDILSRTIEANTLTVHSIHDFDVGTLEPREMNQDSSPYWLFLKETPGSILGITFLISTSISHVFRLIIG
jgi:ABC-type multidrug transport system fused ATPase/permease subunit